MPIRSWSASDVNIVLQCAAARSAKSLRVRCTTSLAREAHRASNRHVVVSRIRSGIGTNSLVLFVLAQVCLRIVCCRTLCSSKSCHDLVRAWQMGLSPPLADEGFYYPQSGYNCLPELFLYRYSGFFNKLALCRKNWQCVADTGTA